VILLLLVKADVGLKEGAAGAVVSILYAFALEQVVPPVFPALS
jgi:hypothetical protein